MKYTIKAPILGFEHINSVVFERIDEFFAKIKSDDGLELMLVNPYMLREYSFSVPRYVQLLLGLNGDSNIDVYCVVVIQKPLEQSMVNFLAPIMFNKDSMVAGQVALSMMDYPNFGFRDKLESFLQITPTQSNTPAIIPAHIQHIQHLKPANAMLATNK